MKQTIRRFEDIVAWQRARILVSDIYRLSSSRAFWRDFGLRNQIRKSAVSIPSNIAEGFERFTLPEFHHFLSIAKGSCGELRTQLYIASDVGYLDQITLEPLMSEAEAVSNIIGRLRRSIEKKPRRTQDSGPRTQDL